MNQLEAKEPTLTIRTLTAAAENLRSAPKTHIPAHNALTPAAEDPSFTQPPKALTFVFTHTYTHNQFFKKHIRKDKGDLLRTNMKDVQDTKLKMLRLVGRK